MPDITLTANDKPIRIYTGDGTTNRGDAGDWYLPPEWQANGPPLNLKPSLRESFLSIPHDLRSEPVHGDIPIRRRGIDEKRNRAVFTAATENGVRTWFGREYLRIRGMDQARYKQNPVILDAHDRSSASKVIGRGEVSKEGRELVIDVTFAVEETQLARDIWNLVRGNFISAGSVGFFRPESEDDIVFLEEGESDGRGDTRIDGPAVIYLTSELLEFSIVPVPADMSALVRRGLLQDGSEERAAIKTWINYWERATGAPKPEASETSREVTTVMTTKKKEEVRSPEENTDETEERQPKAPQLNERAQKIRALKESVFEICPEGLEELAQRLVTESASYDDGRFDEIRRALLEEQTKRAKPVGTPEPKDADATDETQLSIEKVDGEVLVRSICG